MYIGSPQIGCLCKHLLFVWEIVEAPQLNNSYSVLHWYADSIVFTSIDHRLTVFKFLNRHHTTYKTQICVGKIPQMRSVSSNSSSNAAVTLAYICAIIHLHHHEHFSHIFFFGRSAMGTCLVFVHRVSYCLHTYSLVFTHLSTLLRPVIAHIAQRESIYETQVRKYFGSAIAAKTNFITSGDWSRGPHFFFFYHFSQYLDKTNTQHSPECMYITYSIDGVCQIPM